MPVQKLSFLKQPVAYANQASRDWLVGPARGVLKKVLPRIPGGPALQSKLGEFDRKHPAAANGLASVTLFSAVTFGAAGLVKVVLSSTPSSTKPAEQLVEVTAKCLDNGQGEKAKLEITREINQGSAKAKSVTKKAFTLTKNFSEGRRGTGCNQIADGYNASNETIKNYPPKQRAGVVPIMKADWTSVPGALYVETMPTVDFMKLKDWIPQAGTELTGTKEQTVLFLLDPPEETYKDSKKGNGDKRENARKTFGAINRFVATGE